MPINKQTVSTYPIKWGDVRPDGGTYSKDTFDTRMIESLVEKGIVKSYELDGYGLKVEKEIELKFKTNSDK